MTDVRVIYATRLAEIATGAAALAGAATKVSQASEQVFEHGGTINIQPQVAFMTGAMARLLKDWGVLSVNAIQTAVSRLLAMKGQVDRHVLLRRDQLAGPVRFEHRFEKSRAARLVG